MTKQELIDRLRKIETTQPSMGSVAVDHRDGWIGDARIRYVKNQREYNKIYKSRVDASLSLASHIADVLERGEKYDFNSAEFINSGLTESLGFTFGSQINKMLGFTFNYWDNK